MVLRLRQYLNTVETTTCYFSFEFITTTSFDDDLYDFPDYYPFLRKLFCTGNGKWDGCSRFGFSYVTPTILREN
jgi:hypothetical protein